VPDHNRSAYAAYRLSKAKDCLLLADTLPMTDIGYATMLNRSYYAVFHAMRAVLALDEKDFKKHSSVISYFRQTYIKQGIFSAACSKTIENLFRLRQKADYDDFYVISKNDAEKQLADAKVFVAEIERYLQDKLENEE